MSKSLLKKLTTFFYQRFERAQAYIDIYHVLEQAQGDENAQRFFLKALIDQYELSDELEEGLYDQLTRAFLIAPTHLLDAYMQLAEAIVLCDALNFKQKISQVTSMTRTFRSLCEAIHYVDLYHAVVKFFPKIFEEDPDESSLLPLISFYTFFKIQPDFKESQVLFQKNYEVKLQCVGNYQEEALTRLNRLDKFENILFCLSILICDSSLYVSDLKYATFKLFLEYLETNSDICETFCEHELLKLRFKVFIAAFATIKQIQEADAQATYPSGADPYLIGQLNNTLKKRLKINGICEKEADSEFATPEQTPKKKRRRRKKRKKPAPAAGSLMTVGSELLPEPNGASSSGVSGQGALEVRTEQIKVSPGACLPNPYESDEIQRWLENFETCVSTSSLYSAQQLKDYLLYINAFVYEEYFSIESHWMIEAFRFIHFATQADFEEAKWNILESIDLLNHLAEIIFSIHDIHKSLVALDHGGEIPLFEKRFFDESRDTLQFVFQFVERFDIKKERFSRRRPKDVSFDLTHEMVALIDSAFNELFNQLLEDDLFNATISHDSNLETRPVHETHLVELLSEGVKLLCQIAPQLDLEKHDTYLFKFMLVTLMGVTSSENKILNTTFSMTLIDSYRNLTIARCHENVTLDHMALILLNMHEERLQEDQLNSHRQVACSFMDGMAARHRDEREIINAVLYVIGQLLTYSAFHEDQLTINSVARNIASAMRYYKMAKKEAIKPYKDFIGNLFFIELEGANGERSEVCRPRSHAEFVIGYFLFSLLLKPEKRSVEQVVEIYQRKFSSHGLEFSVEEGDFIERRQYLKILSFLLAAIYFDPGSKEFYSQTMFYLLERVEQNGVLRKKGDYSAGLLSEIFMTLRDSILGNFDSSMVYPPGYWCDFSEINLELRKSLPAYELRNTSIEPLEAKSLERFVISTLQGDYIEVQYFLKVTQTLPWQQIFARDQDWMKLYLKVMLPVLYPKQTNLHNLALYFKPNFEHMTLQGADFINLDSKHAALMLLFLFVSQNCAKYLSCLPIFEGFLTAVFSCETDPEVWEIFRSLSINIKNSHSVSTEQLSALPSEMEMQFSLYDQLIALSFLKFAMTCLQEEQFYLLNAVPFIEVLHAIASLSDEREDELSIDVFILLLEQCPPNSGFIENLLREVLDYEGHNPLRNKIKAYCEQPGEWTQPLIELHKRLKTFNLTRKQKKQLNSIFNAVTETKNAFIKTKQQAIQFQSEQVADGKECSDFVQYFKGLIEAVRIPENMSDEFSEFIQGLFQKQQARALRQTITRLKSQMTLDWVLSHDDKVIVKIMHEKRIPEKYLAELQNHYKKIQTQARHKCSGPGKSEQEKSEKKRNSSPAVASSSNQTQPTDFSDALKRLDLNQLSQTGLNEMLPVIFNLQDSEFTTFDSLCREKLVCLFKSHAVQQFIFIQKFPGKDIYSTMERTLKNLLENWRTFSSIDEGAKDFVNHLETLQTDPDAAKALPHGIVRLGGVLFKFLDEPYQLLEYTCDAQELSRFIETSETPRTLHEQIFILQHQINHNVISFSPVEFEDILVQICSKMYAFIKPDLDRVSEIHSVLVDLNHFFEHPMVVAAQVLFERLKTIGCYFEKDREHIVDISSGSTFEIEGMSLQQCFLLSDDIKNIARAGGFGICDLEPLKQMIVKRYSLEQPISLYKLIHEAYAKENMHHIKRLHQALWKKLYAYLSGILYKQMTSDKQENPSGFNTVYGFIPEDAIDYNFNMVLGQIDAVFNVLRNPWLFGGIPFSFFSEQAVETFEKKQFDLDVIAPDFETPEALFQHFEKNPDFMRLLSKQPFCPCEKELPQLVRLKLPMLEVDIHVGRSNFLEKLYYCPLTALEIAYRFNNETLPFSGVDSQVYLEDLSCNKRVRFPNLEGKIASIEEPGQLAILLALMMKAEYKKGCVIEASFKKAFQQQVKRVFQELFNPGVDCVYLVKNKLNEIIQYGPCHDERYTLCIQKLQDFVRDYADRNQKMRERYGQFSSCSALQTVESGSSSGIALLDRSILNDRISSAETADDIINLVGNICALLDQACEITPSLISRLNQKGLEVFQDLKNLNTEQFCQINPMLEKLRESPVVESSMNSLLKRFEQLFADHCLVELHGEAARTPSASMQHAR